MAATQPDGNGSRPRVSMTRRHTQGRAHFGQCLAWWLQRSDLSYAQTSAVADWATGETRCLIGSQIAHLRHSTLRNPNFRLIESLSATNQAIADWQTDRSEALQQYGPLPSSLSPQLMDGAVWLHDPEVPDQPLSLCQFVELFTGHLTLPYVDAIAVSDRDARHLNEELAGLINADIAKLGLGPRDGIEAFMAAYPVKDQSRRQRLKELVLLGHGLEPSELEDELAAIASAISQLRKLPPGTFTPTELYTELTAHRRRV
jgi:hypothetical protein